jgi:rSAM/selenodomain-associated transferase 1
MSPAPQADVRLFTRDGCHLCTAARQVIEPVVMRWNARLTEHDIDSPATDALLRAHYDHAVPVVHVNGWEVGRHRVEAEAVERALRWGSVNVVVLGKYPTPGKVKTRLCASPSPITLGQAAGLHRVFMLHLLRRFAELRPARLVLAFDPASARTDFQRMIEETLPRHLSAQVELVAQPGGDLGCRLVAAHEYVKTTVRERSGRHTLFFGCDSPHLPDAHLDAAVTLLLANDACLGPTPDGGYWTIGCDETVDLGRALDGIPWSSGRECQETLKRLNLGNYRVGLADTWEDVDYPSDLIKLLSQIENSGALQDRVLVQRIKETGLDVSKLTLERA